MKNKVNFFIHSLVNIKFDSNQNLNNMKKFFLITLITITLGGCQGEKDASVPTNIVNYFEESSLPAAIMGSTDKDGKTTWYAFGPSIWGGADTISKDHIFRFYSMTKAIASVAALQLVERDLVGLDDPLNELMPEMVSIPVLTEDGELVETDKAITLRLLLSHTAGFGYDIFDPRLQAFDRTGWKYEDLPRLFEPGSRWHYGTNTDWVGKIIEKISGQDLETYLRENITGPLEMNSTWFNVPQNLTERIVSWGTRDSTGFQEYPRIPQEPVTVYSAGGGLFGSAKDYLTFLECVINDGKYEGGQILKPETVEMMLENQLPDGLTLDFGIPEEGLPTTMARFPDESDTYGLAWAIEDSEDEMVRPKGSVYWAGYANSYFTLDKKNGVAIVYFTQFLPFNDKESFDFYKLFEKEVYAGINNK